MNWHCSLVQLCRWLAHVFSLIAEPDGYFMSTRMKLCKFVVFTHVASILRSLAAQSDCEILAVVRCAKPFASSPPGTPDSNHYHGCFPAVRVLKVPETAAPVLEHFSQLILRVPFVAVPCSSLHMFAHMILGSFRWHSS